MERASTIYWVIAQIYVIRGSDKHAIYIFFLTNSEKVAWGKKVTTLYGPF